MAGLWISVKLGVPQGVGEAIMAEGFQIFLHIRLYWGPQSTPHQICRCGTRAPTFVYRWASNSSPQSIREAGVQPWLLRLEVESITW